MEFQEIIVLSPGRTGSSLLALMLATLGIDMGDIVDSPTSISPLCYGEDQGLGEILQLHVGSTIDCTHPNHSVIWSESLRVDIGQWISLRRETSNIWGFKVPAFVHVAAYCLPLFGNPYLIVSNRDYDSFNRSATKAWGLSDNQVRRLWHKRMGHIYDVLRQYNCPVFYCDFNNLIAFPEEVIMRLCDFLGINASINMIKAAVGLIDIERIGSGASIVNPFQPTQQEYLHALISDRTSNTITFVNPRTYQVVWKTNIPKEMEQKSILAKLDEFIERKTLVYVSHGKDITIKPIVELGG